jgi:hypothetical protein
VSFNVSDYHVSANNMDISHKGARETCQFRDCVYNRIRYQVLSEPEYAVVQEWISTATEFELVAAKGVAREKELGWVLELLAIVSA